MTEAEWLRQINYLYTAKQYRNRLLFNDENTKSILFGVIMGFGGLLAFMVFNIITLVIPNKMSVYRYYKKHPDQLNDKMNAVY